MRTNRVVILGYGHLGKFLKEELEKTEDFQVVKVFNRTASEGVWPLDQFNFEHLEGIDLVVEVAHPNVIKQFGQVILQYSSLFIGSPTCLADEELFETLKKEATKNGKRIFVPAGAFWGGNDIQKMAKQGTLMMLTVTMTKHPLSFKLESPLKEKNEEAKKEMEKATILYEGPVRALCPLAPNNVNTMAGAAIAASNLGFDGVIARLISDPKMPDYHLVEILAEGSDGFQVNTKRLNPAKRGAVTGQLTYYSFLSSVKECVFKPPGIHIC